MNAVASIADQIIGSAKYQLSDNYFENFAPNNDAIGKENIWTGENVGGVSSGNVKVKMVLHLALQPKSIRMERFHHFGRFLHVIRRWRY